MIYFIFSGLSLLTLVIVCVAEPNVEEAITKSKEGPSLERTREGKSKFWELKSMYYISVIWLQSEYSSTTFVKKNKNFLVSFDFEKNRKRPANDLFIFLDKNQVIEICII